MTDTMSPDTTAPLAPVVDLARRRAPAKPKAPGFTCSAFALGQAMAIARRALPASQTGPLPALQHYRIEATFANGVRIRATDIDLDIIATVANAEVTAEGACLIHRDTLRKALKGITKTKDRPLTMRRGARRQDIEMVIGPTTIRPVVGVLEDFPAWKPLDDDAGAALFDTVVFADVVDAISTDEDRPILTGLHLTPTAVVATDSYRLHVVRDLPEIPDLPADGILIPRRGVLEVLALDGEVMTEWDGRTAQFTGEDRTIRVRLIQGTFPNWPGLIPMSPPIEATFDPAAMAAAITALNEWATAGVPVHATVGETGIDLEVFAQDVADVERHVAATVTGCVEPVRIGFNPAYLLDLLRHVDGPATLLISNENKPVIIRQPGPGGAGERIRLQMPVRI
jgi:DNA polymerase-3 subunit beta